MTSLGEVAKQKVADELSEGATLLDDVEGFLARFVVYPSEAARVAHVLWVAHTHRMDAWESTPRIAFLSPEPSSGKTRALEITELLVPEPVRSVNTTCAYLFRRVSRGAVPPTILYDEIDTVFGPRARANEEIRAMLNAGYKKGAVIGRCVNVVGTEELRVYCAVALAGLGDLPDTLRSRSVVIRMRRRRQTDAVEHFRTRVHAEEGHALRDRLARWSNVIEVGVCPEMPAEIVDRDAEVWEPLLAVADSAGGDWPDRARCAGVTLVTAAKATPPSIGVQLLTDLRSIFFEHDGDRLFTDDVISSLVAMDEAPWGDLGGESLDARTLARLLATYGVHPGTIRIGTRTAKGYKRADLADAWERYVPDYGRSAQDGGPDGPAERTVTSVTTSHGSTVRGFSRTP